MADTDPRSIATEETAGRATRHRVVAFVLVVIVIAIAHIFLMRYWSDWTAESATAGREGYIADPMTWPLNGAWFGANVFVAAAAGGLAAAIWYQSKVQSSKS